MLLGQVDGGRLINDICGEKGFREISVKREALCHD